jgi:hypothetical protein
MLQNLIHHKFEVFYSVYYVRKFVTDYKELEIHIHHIYSGKQSDRTYQFPIHHR